jgi:transcriptional regulator with XRE-family HTH domain
MKESKIRMARKARGLSLIGLSRETEIHPSSLSQIETAKLVPPPRVRFALCEFLGLDERKAFQRNGLAA